MKKGFLANFPRRIGFNWLFIRRRKGYSRLLPRIKAFARLSDKKQMKKLSAVKSTNLHTRYWCKVVRNSSLHAHFFAVKKLEVHTRTHDTEQPHRAHEERNAGGSTPFHREKAEKKERRDRYVRAACSGELFAANNQVSEILRSSQQSAAKLATNARLPKFTRPPKKEKRKKTAVRSAKAKTKK